MATSHRDDSRALATTASATCEGTNSEICAHTRVSANAAARATRRRRRRTINTPPGILRDPEHRETTAVAWREPCPIVQTLMSFLAASTMGGGMTTIGAAAAGVLPRGSASEPSAGAASLAPAHAVQDDDVDVGHAPDRADAPPCTGKKGAGAALEFDAPAASRLSTGSYATLGTCSPRDAPGARHVGPRASTAPCEEDGAILRPRIPADGCCHDPTLDPRASPAAAACDADDVLGPRASPDACHDPTPVPRASLATRFSAGSCHVCCCHAATRPATDAATAAALAAACCVTTCCAATAIEEGTHVAP